MVTECTSLDMFGFDYIKEKGILQYFNPTLNQTNDAMPLHIKDSHLR